MEKQNHMYYRFEINGKIGTWMKEWFDGMTITKGTDHTIIEGAVLDHAQLHGILNMIRDLNLELIAMSKVSDQSTQKSPDNHK